MIHLPIMEGGRLTPENLIYSYKYGVFPWFSEPQPAWFFPDPRHCLLLNEFRIPRSVKRNIRKILHVEISMDTAFEQVMRNCAQVHTERYNGTWISNRMIEAYTELHKRGYAHSVEIWDRGNLVGGIYGVHIKKIFSGESMFYRLSGASQLAFIYLIRLMQAMDFLLLDCQDTTEHTSRFGAKPLPANTFWRYICINNTNPDIKWPLSKEDIFAKENIERSHLDSLLPEKKGLKIPAQSIIECLI
ncbi:MAG: leucyl/phenylalanyl-tRNA--protein transferase [Candidatus Hydrogenedentota bacterium]|nr:MAG: leucyl/phenylalanyl-tRNA--protein transferase [Candidatus Hydrogenedentota bacterium]